MRMCGQPEVLAALPPRMYAGSYYMGGWADLRAIWKVLELSLVSTNMYRIRCCNRLSF